ncbi:helix-turn-helix domain-containing protein [Holosporaceae bacterium 'Namur']|nr:helix-turn-helix domain-containing protein [Holosporaceae bacterium 'Namur']
MRTWEIKFLRYFKRNEHWPPLKPLEIKDIRRGYNLSQRDFASMLNISIRTLQNYEIGHRLPSSIACALFGVSATFLRKGTVLNFKRKR